MLKLCSGQGLHAFLSHLASGVDPVLRLELLARIFVDSDRTVQILHSLCSVLVGPYNMDRRLLAFSGDLPLEGLPMVIQLLVDILAVWCIVYATPREDHRLHVEGYPPSM